MFLQHPDVLRALVNDRQAEVRRGVSRARAVRSYRRVRRQPR